MILDEVNEIISSLKEVGADTAHVEIKSCAEGFPKRMWETLSAFANTSGGVVILGVSEIDDGIVVTGLKNPSQFQKDLASVCDQMSPSLRPLIEIHKVDGKSILVAEVPEVSYKEKPCFYKGAGIMSGSFIRVADGDRRLTQYEVQGFLDGRGQPTYDIEPVKESAMEDLDKDLVRLFFEQVKSGQSKAQDWDEKKILRTYRILTDCDGKECLTLGGILCLGEYPQKFLPSLVIHVLAYPEKTAGELGSQGERLLDNVKIEGPLVRAIPEALNTIKKNLQKRTYVSGLFREDILEYPEVFLREALINAVGHRDYAPLARGTAVQIKLFPDRIEVTNPGGLFGPVTEERLGEQGLQASRNSYLMKLLEDVPVPSQMRMLCENRGTGIPSMIASLLKAGMEPPQFNDLRNQFKVICFNHALFDKKTLAWLEQYSNLDLSSRQRFALAYMRHNERINNSQYCRMNDCDSRLALRELNELVLQKVITKYGTRRWTYYIVTEKQARKVVGPQRRMDRREEIIRLIRKNQPITRKKIVDATRLSTPAILYWLRILSKEGKIGTTTASNKDREVQYVIKKEA